MPRVTRKRKSRRSKTYRKKQRGGSNEKPTLENVLGISSMVGYNKNTLLPGLQLSKRSASNYETQMAYKNAIVKKGLFELWSKEPSEIEAKLKENPRLKQFSIQEAKKILRKFYQKFDDIEMSLDERQFELRYGRNAYHIVMRDIEEFEEMKANLVNKLEYFEAFLEKESPGLLGTIDINNNNNYYANFYSNNRNNNNNQNNQNNQNNNYGNAMRRLYGNENE
jgi:hypothetical protein